MAVLAFYEEALEKQYKSIISNWICREYGCEVTSETMDKNGAINVKFGNAKGLPNGKRQILVECLLVTKDCYTVKVFAI